MIHPSYAEMVDAIRGAGEEGNEVDTSRFSIVQATAKRARQLVAGAEPLIEVDDRDGKLPKALSTAVNEFYHDRVHVVTGKAGNEAAAGETDEEA